MSFLSKFYPPGLPTASAVKQAFDQLYRLDDAVSSALPSGSTSIASAVVIQDTRGNRNLYPAANYALGSMYYETDTSLTYLCATQNSANTWIYKDGIWGTTQANKPTLGQADNGLRWRVTDYGHLMLWTWSGGPTGSGAWSFDDDGSYYFADGSNAPRAVGWHACDGSTVNCLLENGTLFSVTLPDCTHSPNYPKNGALFSSAVVAASPAIISGNTGDTTINLSGTSANFTAGGVAALTSVSVAAPNPHHHDQGTLVNDTSAEPAHVVYQRWFRQ